MSTWPGYWPKIAISGAKIKVQEASRQAGTVAPEPVEWGVRYLFRSSVALDKQYGADGEGRGGVERHHQQPDGRR